MVGKGEVRKGKEIKARRHHQKDKMIEKNGVELQPVKGGSRSRYDGEGEGAICKEEDEQGQEDASKHPSISTQREMTDAWLLHTPYALTRLHKSMHTQ